MKRNLFLFLFAFTLSMPSWAQNAITVGIIQYDWSNLDKSFQELKDYGFTSLQLNWSSSKATDEMALKVKEASQKTGLKVTTLVGVPGNSRWNFTEGPATIGLVPTEGREAKIQEYHKMIDFCQKAGIEAMHSHFGFIPEDPSQESYKNFITVMKDLGAYAKERGVMVYFETGQETPTTLIRAITDIGTGNMFINCDVGNLLLYGKANPLDAIRQFGDLVRDVHAKDGTYPSREDPYHLGKEKQIPEGDVDFPAIIKELKKQGYKGAITIECELSGSNQDYALKTRKYLQDLIDNQ